MPGSNVEGSEQLVSPSATTQAEPRWGQNEIDAYNEALSERWRSVANAVLLKVQAIAEDRKSGRSPDQLYRNAVDELVSDSDGEYSYNELSYVVMGMLASGRLRAGESGYEIPENKQEN